MSLASCVAVWCVWAVFGCGGVGWPECQNLPPQPIAENDCECKMTAEYDLPRVIPDWLLLSLSLWT
jgi:hypothetical protein